MGKWWENTVAGSCLVRFAYYRFGSDRYGEGKLLNQVAWRVDARIHPVPISSESYNNETCIPLIHEIRTQGMEVF